MNKQSYLTTLIYLLLTLTLISCRNNPPTPTPLLGNQIDPALIDTQWQLTELNGEPYPTHIVTTIVFTNDGVGGYLICNEWGNAEDITIIDTVFNIPLIWSTTQGCNYNSLSNQFSETLATEAQSYTLTESQLLIQDESAKTIMVFTLTEDTELHWPAPSIKTDSIDEISFTHIIDTWRAAATATINGVLIETNGCLRLDTDDESFYLIWPQNSNITIEEQVQIVGSDGVIWATVDDTLELNGIKLTPPDYWRNLISEECSGPYFVVSEKLRKNNPRSASSPHHSHLE